MQRVQKWSQNSTAMYTAKNEVFSLITLKIVI